MNSFLKSLQKDLSKQGELIDVGGNKYLIIEAAPQIQAKLVQEGMRKAANSEELKGRKSELSKKKITKADREAFKEGYSKYATDEQIEAALKGVNNHFDLAVLNWAMVYVANNFFVEIIRNPDGSRIYENNEEKAKIRESLEASPGTIEKINEAFERIQQKKSPTNQS